MLPRWLLDLAWRVKRRLKLRTQQALQSQHAYDYGLSVDQAPLVLPPTLPDGRPWPLISVVTPSFNQGRYLSETIESVLQQGYPRVEHIIIDGGSTDETSTVLQRYRDKLAAVVSEKDRGQSDALNKGFRLASGDILCWLNSDDQFAPGALASVALAFMTSNADMVSGICEIYQDGVLVHRHMAACQDGPLPLHDMLDLDRGWNAGQFFYQPEVFFTRGLWERAGAHVREDCYYSMDYELWCRFALAGARLNVIGAPLARFRVHPEQKTSTPEKFKQELISVRDRFMEQHRIAPKPSARPPVRFDRRLRAAFINDVGVQHGAGIAHGRLAAGLDMAGHEVQLFALREYVKADGSTDEASFAKAVRRFRPDVIVFGNLHAATRDSVGVMEALSGLCPSFWVAHDFWLLTGRCAYPGDCTAHTSGCGVDCPTAISYPDLPPERIPSAWQRKRDLLLGPNAPVLLANSAWCEAQIKTALPGQSPVVRRISLGAPVRQFRALDKRQARTAIGVRADDFVIAFSVSSLSEKRKGGHFLAEALRDLNLPDLTVILLGHLDVPFEAQGVRLAPLGYVTDKNTLAAALSAADLYIGPSTEETFGQVFIEAALAGTPSLAFDLTGVREAVRDGVSGLLVAPTAQALRDAILALHGDRERCAQLGALARVHACNEFSLESSYRSLFTVWRELGLVDRWSIPHKVGFVRESPLAGGEPGGVSTWRTLSGISDLEGPYPQFGLPTAFRWCHGEQSRLAIVCREAGPHTIRLTYYSPLFQQLSLSYRVNGTSAAAVCLRKTARGRSAQVLIPLQARVGDNIIDLMPERTAAPTDIEPRALSFMISALDVHSEDLK